MLVFNYYLIMITTPIYNRRCVACSWSLSLLGLLYGVGVIFLFDMKVTGDVNTDTIGFCHHITF